jgi:hypothetical protein
MLNLAITTIVFFVAAWFLNSYLNEQGIPNGLTRGVMVLVLASLTSWGVWRTIDWTQQAKVDNPQAAIRNTGGVSQILKDANQAQP